MLNLLDKWRWNLSKSHLERTKIAPHRDAAVNTEDEATMLGDNFATSQYISHSHVTSCSALLTNKFLPGIVIILQSECMFPFLPCSDLVVDDKLGSIFVIVCCFLVNFSNEF